MLDIPRGTPTGLQRKHPFVIHVVVSVSRCLTAWDVVILGKIIPVLACLVRIVADNFNQCMDLPAYLSILQQDN